jgi:hypothetical protein
MVRIEYTFGVVDALFGILIHRHVRQVDVHLELGFAPGARDTNLEKLPADLGSPG